MKVSRSGYYKWLKTKDVLNNYELNRNDMCDLVKEYHKKHPSWGYRHINRQIRVDIGLYVSDNFVHKCCKFLEIKSVYSYNKKHNSIITYYEELNIILDKIKGINYSTTLHSDQGVVYSSLAFTNAHKDYNIIRSMKGNENLNISLLFY